MKNIIIIFFCMSMLMFQATAQNHADVKEIEVSGIVLDSNKDPLIGANIVCSKECAWTWCDNQY